MANPFELAKKTTLSEVSKKSSTGDLSWYEDRGWVNVFGGFHQGDTAPESFEFFVLDAFRKNGIVRACIQEIVTSLSEAPIRAYTDGENGKRNWIPEHPLEELFEEPNNRDSYFEFIERSGQHYFIGGNTFWEKKRDNMGRISALIPIRPDMVIKADTDQDGFPIRFHIRRQASASQPQTISIENIVHIPDVDPLNTVFGMPRLLAALTEIQADNEATLYVNEVLSNHGSPGTIVAIDSEKVRGSHLIERAEARWEEKFGPGSGRGKVAFLPGAHTIHEAGFNLKDLEFKAMREVARSTICAVFGVDPIILGISSKGSSLSGSEHKEARRKLWEQTIIPFIRRWEGAINAFIAPEYGRIKAGFDLSRVEALKENRKDAVERATAMARTASFTMPEIREEAGHSSDVPDNEVIVMGGRVAYADPNNLSLEKTEETDNEEDVEDVEENESTDETDETE